MLDCLPPISQESIDAFGTTELSRIVIHADKLLSQLDSQNPELAKVIRACAELAAEFSLEEPTKEEIETQTQVAIPIVLQLVDRALGAAELQLSLAGQSSHTKQEEKSHDRLE